MGIIYAFLFGHLIDFFFSSNITFMQWKSAITTELEFATNGWFLLLSEDVNHFCANFFHLATLTLIFHIKKKGQFYLLLKKGTSFLGTIHTKSDMILEKQEPPPETVKH